MCVCSLSYPACNARAPYYISICGLSGCTIFFPNHLINGMIFEGKKCYWTWTVCFDFLYSSWLKELWFWEELSEILSQTYIHLYVKYPLFLSACNQTWIFLTDFREKKYSNIKFHENLSSGSRLFHAERRTDRQTDITKLVVAFCNFSKAPNKAFGVLNLPRGTRTNPFTAFQKVYFFRRQYR